MENYFIIDIAVLAIILISSLLALSRGLVRETLSLVAWIGSFALAFYFYAALAPELTKLFGIKEQKLAEFISGVTIFLGALLVLQILAITISSIANGERMGIVNRLFGFLFGAARGYIIICAIYLLYSLVIKFDNQPDMVKYANTRPYMAWGSQKLYNVIPVDFWKKMDNHHENIETIIPLEADPIGQPLNADETAN